MPDSESLDTRRRKRIIEYIISGFSSVNEAKAFARIRKSYLDNRIGNYLSEVKMHTEVAAPDTIIAITDQWVGPTVLKLTFTDIPHQNTAWFIVEDIRLQSRNSDLKIEKETVREKPQPQTIGLETIPRTSKIFNVG